nr:MAG TPA: hypothetical protein [Caudoviricetes sp.]
MTYSNPNIYDTVSATRDREAGCNHRIDPNASE